jgi:DNA end-binding protein Ku
MPTRKKPAKSPAHTAHARFGRPAWQGHLRLSLVSCPVALYGAVTHANDVTFHLLNPKTHNRIRMIPTDPDTGPIERADLVKGYEIEKNRYVVVTDDELQQVRLETTGTIDIERFVAEDDIDRLYWNDPYYLVPGEKSGMETYGVIRDALAASGRIAIGRVVMHTRERMVALEPRGKGILAWTLRAAAEVIDPAHAFAGIAAAHPDRKMVEIARKIIDQKKGRFDPAMFEDRYETALRALIRAKRKGHKPVRAEPVADTNVIDLMEALKKSLKSRSGHAARVRAHARKRGR